MSKDDGGGISVLLSKHLDSLYCTSDAPIILYTFKVFRHLIPDPVATLSLPEILDTCYYCTVQALHVNGPDSQLSLHQYCSVPISLVAPLVSNARRWLQSDDGVSPPGIHTDDDTVSVSYAACLGTPCADLALVYPNPKISLIDAQGCSVPRNLYLRPLTDNNLPFSPAP